MNRYTTNPLTGRKIKVGGSTHKNVMKQTGGYSWKNDVPSRGQERYEQYEKCGDKCFLRPSNKGFPICERNCEGILSAYRRARQYHYEDIATSAKHIGVQSDCHWAKKYQ